MGKFINSKKEIFLGERFFKVETQPDEYDGSVYRKAKSAFWASHGFDVSAMYANFYSHFSGIESDKYFSDDLYYFYALPTLNRQDFMWAYTDKNIADQVFSAGINGSNFILNLCHRGQTLLRNNLKF